MSNAARFLGNGPSKTFLVMTVKEILKKINYCCFEADFTNLFVWGDFSQFSSTDWRELSIKYFPGLLNFYWVKSKLGEVRHVSNRNNIAQLVECRITVAL